MLEEQLNGHGVVSIGEHVDVDFDLVADRALRRIAAAIDLRTDRFDDDARRRRLDFFARLIQA
jgi:hypothetical protein